MGEPAMNGKVCLVTGASSGIGKATALGLAALGARTVLVVRDRAKGESTATEIRTQHPDASVDVVVADLSSQAAIRTLAAEVLARFPRIDVLVNNAGGFFLKRETTVDGLERTFATNHLAYFQLTTLLLDRLRESAPARIVNVSSATQDMNYLNFDDPQGNRGYRPDRAYAQSKLANVMFTYELARRLEGTGVTANCLHPGLVDSNIGLNNGPWWGWLSRIFHWFASSIPPSEGAATSIYLASSPQVEGLTGKYFRECQPAPTAPLSYDRSACERLWTLSEALVANSAPRELAQG